MSTFLTIEGKEYTLATVAGKEFEFTKEYLLLLIKQGKIDGKKIANRWYVHVPSAKLFFEDVKKTHRERREKISIERKVELQKYSKTSVPVHAHRRTAALETLTIVILGISIGLTGYLGSTSKIENLGSTQAADRGFFKHFALSFYTFISGTDGAISIKSSYAIPAVPQNMALVASSTISPEAIIVAPEKDLSIQRVDAIRDSFSDEVNVTIDSKNSDTGIIVPKFKSKDGEAYRFIMVPVTQGNDS